MAKEYLWKGKYRILSEEDPATYYPNGASINISSENESCYRLAFPPAPSNYFYNGSDFPSINPNRIYVEKEDITEDSAWQLLLVENSSAGCSGSSSPFGNAGYLIMGGDFSPDMVLNLDTGKLLGKTGEMDEFVSGINLPKDYQVDEQNYATVGTASYFRNGVGFLVPIRFTARVFNKANPNVYTDKTFEYKLSNNWSSDRDYLILNIKNQFFVNCVTGSNREYLDSQKARGFFPGPP